MEACIVQRVEPLLEGRWCVDPFAHMFSHLEFYLVDCVNRELIGVTNAKAFTMPLFQVLSQTLLVVGDNVFRDAECVVVGCPMQQVVAVVVDQLRQIQRIHKFDPLQDRLKLVDIK